MRNVVTVLGLGLALGGCSSFSMPEMFRPTPVNVTIPLESIPSGAEAKTSLGPSCRTPCAVSVPAAESFSVSFTLDRYLPQTIPVQVTRQPADFSPGGSPAATLIDPNPVFAELQPSGPQRRKGAKRAVVAKRANAPAASPFPPPR